VYSCKAKIASLLLGGLQRGTVDYRKILRVGVPSVYKWRRAVAVFFMTVISLLLLYVSSCALACVLFTPTAL